MGRTLANRPLELLVDHVEDPSSRENFDRIRSFVASDLFTKFDGRLYEIEFKKAVTNLKLSHNLNFLPKDAFIVYQSSAGACTLNNHLFDRETFDITTTGAVTVRFIAGQFVTDR